MADSSDPPWDVPEAPQPAAELLPPIQCTKNGGKLPEGVEMVWTPLAPLGTFEPASPANPERERDQTTPDMAETAQTDTQASQQETGNVPSIPRPESAAGEHHTRTREIAQRFQAEGRWPEIEPLRNQMMKDAKKRIPDKAKRQAWVYGELDRMYPPCSVVESKSIGNSSVDAEKVVDSLSTNGGLLVDSVRADDGSIQGLGTIPEGWPELPANASMSMEIGWVQANRLRIVEERPGRATVVDLGKALSPAPSWAALGWLETSIRSYAKFVDVAARASGADDGEAGVMRRERMSLDEVRSLLAEMEGDRPGK